MVRSGRRKLPECRIVLAGGDTVRPSLVAADRVEFYVPANARLVLSWSG